VRFKKYIKEATYKQDKFFRKIAVGAWNRFKKALDKAYKEYEKTGRVPLEYHSWAKGWILYGAEFGYPDLSVMLTYKERYPGGAGGFTSNAGKTSKGEPLKLIALGALLDPDNFQYINTRVNKKLFIHEFIHYLDFKRAGDRENTVKLLKAKGEKAYFNTASEFNAYFQEGSQEVEDLFKAIYKARPEKIKEFLSSLEVFKNWVVLKSNMFSGYWYENIEGKWKRKFLKRLYTLYKALVKKYEV
jgi:hypothetical protein